MIDGGALRATVRIAIAWFFLGLLALVASMLTGCASGKPKLTAGVCDEREVMAWMPYCRAEVELACDPYKEVQCEAEDECRRELCRACPKDARCSDE